MEYKYKGKCGVCGVSLYEDDIRYKRVTDEPYICEECYMLYTECRNCVALFNCPFDHDSTNCEEL